MYNFEVAKMRDPREYDWKEEFANLAEQARQSEDPVIFMEPGMVLGLAQYAMELERGYRRGGLIKRDVTWQTTDERATIVIKDLAHRLGLSEQIVGANASHTIYAFLEAGYSTTDTSLMVLGVALSARGWCV